VSPVLVLQARAEARALLFKCGEYEDSGDAIGPLLMYAHESSLVEEIGADGVLAIIEKAFEGIAYDCNGDDGGPWPIR
jgi:hypothetical protein